MLTSYGTGADGKTTYAQAILNSIGLGLDSKMDELTGALRSIYSGGYGGQANGSVLQTVAKDSS